MSDQSESEESVPASPAALRDARWLSGGVWAALLFVLVVTSWAGIGGGGFGDASLSLLSYVSFATGPGDNASNPDLVVTVMLVFSVVVAILLVQAWTRFANTTFALLDSISIASDDPTEESPAGRWLSLASNGRSEITDVLGLIGLTWAAIVLRPAVIATLQVYSN